MTQPTQRDRFTFPNTEAGRELRRHVAESLTHNGITSEESEETLSGHGWSCVLLRLTVTSKRPGEGQIAADMKARKS